MFLSRWKSENWLEKVEIPTYSLEGKVWETYETYMQACNLGGGLLLVRFPPEATEDNRLHVHPRSDRRITVISGSGEFVRCWNKKVEIFPLIPGDRVWMPRGVLHTFRAGAGGLLVESLHSPFVPFDDPLCLVYPKKEMF